MRGAFSDFLWLFDEYPYLIRRNPYMNIFCKDSVFFFIRQKKHDIILVYGH